MSARSAPVRPPRAALLLALLAPALFAAGASAAPAPDEARKLIGPPAAPLGDAPLQLAAGDLDAVRAVRTGPGRLPQLQVAVAGGESLPLPLRDTRVFAELTGFVARVDVVQTYQNPFAEPIEAVYTFPLPENAAVDDLTIRIGERVIRAEIQKRDDARKTYEDAKESGHTAALLEQERPNIFTQSVANIAPGESIDVSIRYVQHLTYDAGTYEFVFPMVVGPRFMPGAPTGHGGTGWSPDTTEVPDASRISPPVIGAGLRTGHDIDVEVVVDAGFSISDVQTPTHQVDAHTDHDGTLSVRLADGDRIPNRDFVLRYRVAGEQPRAAAFAAPGPKGEGGVVSLVVQPPRLDLDALVGQREIIFVVDVSGSMSGVPLAQAKAAMQRALRGLGPDDTFNVHTFAGQTARAFPAPRPANAASIESALRFVDAAQAGGGTYLADAVQQALGDVGEGRHRYVVFLTDGFVGNEAQIFDAAEALVAAQAKAGRKARVFGMGIGGSVNRHLIEGLATAGDGAAMYVLPTEMPDGAIDRFWRAVDHPVLTDVRVDWGDLEVSDVEPAVMPDLLATGPLVILAKYGAPGRGTVRITGKVDGKDVTLPVEVALPPAIRADGGPRRGEALPALWARSRVETLSRRLWQGHDATAVEAITALGLEYRLVTAYTSFVAVDRSRVVGDGAPKTVVQPVEAPLGVDMRRAAPGAVGVMGSLQGTSRGFGGLGMRGTGSGGGGYAVGGGSVGYGVGHGRLGAARKAKKAPKLRVGKPVVMGSLDKSIIERVIRRHRNQVRSCYERALQKDPALKGKIVVKLAIDGSGRVVSASATDASTLPSEAVRACLVQKVKTWRFPAGGDGMVVVTYPFVFSPGDTPKPLPALVPTP